MDKLLPCPFCGGKELERDEHGPRHSPFYVVRCTDCAVEGPSSRQSADEAVQKWNTRHAPAAIAPAQDETDFIASKILSAALERKCPYARKSESGQVFFVRYYFAGHVNIESDRKTVKDWLVASLRAGHTYND